MNFIKDNALVLGLVVVVAVGLASAVAYKKTKDESDVSVEETDGEQRKLR